MSIAKTYLMVVNTKILMGVFLISAYSGCNSEDKSGKSSKNNESSQQIVDELRKQNKLLEAQQDRQKAEDTAKSKLAARNSRIEDAALSNAKTVDDYFQKIQIIYKTRNVESKFNESKSELRSLLLSSTKGIESDDEFDNILIKTASDWTVLNLKAMQAALNGEH